MSDIKQARFKADVVISVKFKQIWSVYQGDRPYDAQKEIEDAIRAQIKAGTISLKSLLKDCHGHHDGIDFKVDWPSQCYVIPSETIQEERLRLLGDEIEGELIVVDVSPYEVTE